MSKRPIITLTTDLGYTDYYLASIKALIYSQCPGALVIDISHTVAKFDIQQAAFILGNAYHDFPESTIHIIGIQAELTPERGHLIVNSDGQFFIGADNGIFSLIPGLKPSRIIEITHEAEKVHLFPVKDVFARAACYLAGGGNMEELGRKKKNVNQRTGFNPVITENSIRGSVIYVDDFGNLVVNVTESTFFEALRKRKFIISFRSGGYTIKKISENYPSVPQGEMLAFFNHAGFLEIAMNSGNANQLLGISLHDIILIEFYG